MRRSLQLPPLILNEVREAQDPYEEESPDARAIKRQRTISQAKPFRISTKKLTTHDISGDSKPRQAVGLSMGGLTKALRRSANQSKDYLSTTKISCCKTFVMSDGGYATEGATSRTISTACTNSSSDDSTSAVTYHPEYQQVKMKSDSTTTKRESSSRKSARDKTLILRTTHSRFPSIRGSVNSTPSVLSPTARLDTAARQINDFSREAMSDCANILAQAELQMQSLNAQIASLKPKTELMQQRTDGQSREFFEQRLKRQLKTRQMTLAANSQYNDAQISLRP